jgi:hypothetical protein
LAIVPAIPPILDVIVASPPQALVSRDFSPLLSFLGD